jgi:hypothetical protein
LLVPPPLKRKQKDGQQFKSKEFIDDDDDDDLPLPPGKKRKKDTTIQQPKGKTFLDDEDADGLFSPKKAAESSIVALNSLDDRVSVVIPLKRKSETGSDNDTPRDPVVASKHTTKAEVASSESVKSKSSKKHSSRKKRVTSSDEEPEYEVSPPAKKAKVANSSKPTAETLSKNAAFKQTDEATKVILFHS